MPQVTGNVKTWGLQSVPADEKLIVKFIPSTASTLGSTLLPLREEQVTPAPDGGLEVNLAQTTNTSNGAFFRIVIEWYVRDRLNNQWVIRGRSEIPGELHVPAAGGSIARLLSVTPRPGSILRGYGPPPKSLRSVLYIDVSGTKPRLYAPKGSLI